MNVAVRSFLLALLTTLAVPATADAADTAEIYQQHKGRVVQIRLLEASSGARAGLGSGFVAHAGGLVVTNYHVVSKLVLRPDHYRAELADADNRSWAIALLAFDAVNDLAILKTDMPYRGHFSLVNIPPQKGARVFSMGTPLDLDFSIVEGTYNGLIPDSLYERIHYSGAINAGMSGGPAILENGEVVGVNVASAGNQVGFLVPIKFVVPLIAQAVSSPSKPGQSLLDVLRNQLLANQERFMSRLLAKPIPTVKFGPYDVPDKLATHFKCWGDTEYRRENRYENITQHCSFRDNIYISRSHRTGFIEYQHRLLSSRELEGMRFYNLYQNYFKTERGRTYGNKEDVSRYRCQSDFIGHNRLTLKVVLCLRGYKRLPGLYDVFLTAATLDEADRGVQTSATLAGVTFENATRFVKHYLESFAWNR